MKSMPYEIKQKLRQYARVQIKAKQLSKELGEMFDNYGVPEDNLVACADISWNSDEPQTEGLAFLHNGECSDIEETIREIEKVFLYFAKKDK